MYRQLKLAYTFFIVLFMLMSMGCANQGGTNSTKSPLQISGTEMAYFWVTKDTLISWQQILPLPTAEPAQDKATYKVSFVISNSGTMQQVSMVNTSDGTKIPVDELTGISEYRFYPTAQNISRQAVMINTIVTL
ncbi:hypothetical protein Shal_3963 [Shewanella halifaxensis HAW-EB4]|uniref:Lipoprotein n=1 Tax=Shewanella halifaxensis (strain HAW-EB4) TaxID=458817 RepID=B0TJT5_SHEHH|nr:hypothetical protein [Shewanella halifaxensis]ABZ78503.1 hypothetical protein Shal_3963 [Shewanella halifaxensis HAW-EB4]